MKPPPLAVSVLTSCSPWQLSELAYEVGQVLGDVRFDILVPRLGHVLDKDLPPEVTPTELMARDGQDAVEADRLVRQCEECERWERENSSSHRSVQIAALATYFPDLTSRVSERRAKAVKALTNAIRVGFRLAAKGRMSRVCVEAVCGTILDRYDTTDQRPLVGTQSREVKFRWLCESLVEVFGAIEKEYPPQTYPFAVALEFEPGHSYLLNDLEALAPLIAVFKTSRQSALLHRHLGFNLDIAHLRIAGVRAAALRERKVVSRIVHAHLADHPPRMHTRDQPPGTWTSSGGDPEALEFVDLLLERQEAYEASDKSGLPFSGAVALELEGNYDPACIHNSIPAMRRLLAVAQRNRAAKSAV